MFGPKSKRDLKAAKDKIEELKATIEALKEQRDKIRSTRDELRFKLTDACETLIDYREILIPYLDTQLNNSALGLLPDERIISHISHRRDSNRPLKEDLLLTGQMAAARIEEVIAELSPKSNPTRILDFGCGFGRVTRFLTKPGRELVGCDIDNDAIEWARANLSEFADFITSNDSPPLPNETGQFDTIFALSVFTHLPELLQNQWLSEIHKHLNPGGLFLATTHGSSFQRFIPENIQSEFLEKGFLHIDLGKTPDLPDYYLTAFHGHEYIRKQWQAHGFKVIRIEEQSLPQTSVRQDLVVATKE